MTILNSSSQFINEFDPSPSILYPSIDPALPYIRDGLEKKKNHILIHIYFLINNVELNIIFY